MKKSILCAELEAGNIFLPVTKVQTLPVRATISYYSISNNQQGVKSTLPSQSHTNPSTSHLSRGEAPCVSRGGLVWRTLPPASSSATQTWAPSPWPAPGCRHPPPPPRRPSRPPSPPRQACLSSALAPQPNPEAARRLSSSRRRARPGTSRWRKEAGGRGAAWEAAREGRMRGPRKWMDRLRRRAPPGVRSAAARPPWLRAEGRRCSHLRGFSFLIKNKPGAWIHNLPTSLRNN